MIRLVVNIALYQLAWLACVMGAAAYQPLWGYAAAGAAVAWHLWQAPRALPEGLLLLAAAVVGAVFEAFLVRAGWVRVAPELLTAGIVPLWMVALWAAFATTFNVSLRTLRAKPWLVAVLGLAGGPLAYAAGERLGAFAWQDAVAALVAIGLGWGLLLPLLLKAARRLDGYAA